MKPCIVVVDMLKDFFKRPPLSLNKKRLIRNINDLTKLARKNNVPIIWVKQEFKPDLSDAFLSMKKRDFKSTIKGTEGAEILDELNRRKDEQVIVKKRYSAFFNTKLDQILKNLGVDTLIIVGINTHACVRMTAIDAYQRDYEVMIAKNCVFSWDWIHHMITLFYLKHAMCIKVWSNKKINNLFTK